MKYYVYFLRSLKDKGIYVGKTNNVRRRLNEHNSGQVQSRKSRTPLELLGYVEANNEAVALKIEKEYKKGFRREEIKKKYNL